MTRRIVTVALLVAAVAGWVAWLSDRRWWRQWEQAQQPRPKLRVVSA